MSMEDQIVLHEWSKENTELITSQWINYNGIYGTVNYVIVNYVTVNNLSI